MAPDQQDELTQDQIDERTCGERIDYWCKKMGCALIGEAVLRPGQPVEIRIGIKKLPPDVLKEMRKAEKSGQAFNPAGQPS